MTRLIVTLLVTVMFLSGCNNVPSEDETKLQTESDAAVSTERETELQTESDAVDGSDDETNTENICESTENTVETTENINESEAVSTDDPILNAIINALWVKSLQGLEMFAGESNGADCWERTYEVEAHLKEFDLSQDKYALRLIYPNRKMNFVDFYWPDYINDINEYYDQADEYLLMNYVAEIDYQAQSSWIKTARKESMMRIKGVIKSESYEQAGLFVDHLFPYTYYSLWGSVLKVAGEHYLEYAGSVWGKFSGQIYMTAFDFETLEGTFWICIDDIDPIEVTMRFHNQDCIEYFLELTDTVWMDSIPDRAWIGLSFDLETSEMN